MLCDIVTYAAEYLSHAGGAGCNHAFLYSGYAPAFKEKIVTKADDLLTYQFLLVALRSFSDQGRSFDLALSAGLEGRDAALSHIFLRGISGVLGESCYVGDKQVGANLVSVPSLGRLA